MLIGKRGEKPYKFSLNITLEIISYYNLILQDLFTERERSVHEMQSEEMDSKSITFYHFAFHLYHSTVIKMNNEEFTLISFIQNNMNLYTV